MLLLLLAGPPARQPAPPRPVQQPRPAGTVAGQLRHKGCQSAPAGATISAIGLDATAIADAAGRFAIQLPPGSYSLVIDGPGLASPSGEPVVAIAPDTPSLVLPGDRIAPSQAIGEPWVRASPGTGPGQLA